MIEADNITPAEKDGRYEFSIYYSEQEHACRVEKEQNKLHVDIDNVTSAILQINGDGSIEQIEGSSIAPSVIDYIKKKVLGLNV